MTSTEDRGTAPSGPHWTRGTAAVPFGEAFRASLANPAAVAALAIPLVPIAVLGGLSAWLVPSSVVLSDGAFAVIDPPAWFAVVQLALLVLGIAALVFGMIAASSAVISDLTSRQRDVVGAWGTVLRRLPAHLVPVAVLGLIVGAVLTIAFAAALFGFWWIGLIVVAIAIIAAAPLATAPAMLLLADAGGIRALRDAVSVMYWSRDPGVARARIAFALGVGCALPLAVVWLTQNLDGSVLIVLARDLLRAIGFIAGAMIIVVGTTSVAIATRIPERRELPPATARPGARRVAVIAAVGALLVPPLVTALVGGLNPANVARVTTVEMGKHWDDLEVTSFGGGAAVFSRIGDESGLMSLCTDAACTPYKSIDAGSRAIRGLGDGSLLWAGVRPVFAESTSNLTSIELVVTRLEPSNVPASTPEDDEPYFPSDFTGATTSILWSEAVPEESARDADVWRETMVAVALDGEGMPVIALVAQDSRDYALLRIFRCDDIECTESREVADAEVLWQYPFTHSKWAILGVAVLPDGTIAVAVVHPHNGPAPLQYVAIEEGSEPRVQVLDDIPADIEYADNTAGVRVLVNGDGTATLAYRPHGSTDGYILTCADSLCSEHSTETMRPSGTDPFFPPATLAIDDTGRPMYLQRDAAGAVWLVSCLDVACAETAAAVLADPEYPGGPIGLALSADGRPIVVAAAPAVDPYLARRITERSLVVECVDARCGLP